MGHLSRLPMLAAVDFNYKAARQADKIREIGPQWELATEAQAVDLLASQKEPQPLFSI